MEKDIYVICQAQYIYKLQLAPKHANYSQLWSVRAKSEWFVILRRDNCCAVELLVQSTKKSFSKQKKKIDERLQQYFDAFIE